MSSPTQDRLIAATTQLMLQHGYAATGVNDICKHAGVSKGAFYHSFESKEALTLAAVDAYYDAGVRAMGSVDVSSYAPADQLVAFVEGVAELGPYLWEHGCLLGGLATEVADASDAIRVRVAGRFDQLHGIVAFLAEAFVADLAEPVFTADDLAEEFLMVIEGGIVLARAHRDPARIRTAIRRFATHLRYLPRA